tara:strand:- start:155 stop:481 length:327 start_codon:yes stop_codon:yes gene_type:complete
MIIYETSIWQEQPRKKLYRIQTNDPAIARKLRRRNSCKLVLSGLNKNVWVYVTTFKFPWLAKRALQRLTGQKIEKTPDTEGFDYQTIPKLTSKKEIVIDNGPTFKKSA